jgi:hypothetical protein
MPVDAGGCGGLVLQLLGVLVHLLPTSIGDKPSGINLLHGHRSSDERSNHIVATGAPMCRHP